MTAKTVSGLVDARRNPVTSPFRAAYDADGAVGVQVLPNAVTLATVSDPGGRAVSGTYTACDGRLVASSTRVWGSDGNVASDTGLGRSSSYTYDGADRLTGTRTVLPGAGSCTVRSYTFDDDSNRTGLSEWHAPGSVLCPATSGAPTASAPRTYDVAGRATLAGYGYDTLGRTTALPGADSPSGVGSTVTYYGNDLVATISTGTTTRAYAPDAVGRIASWTDTTGGVVGPTVTNHYDDDSDSPVWTDNGDGTWTRAIPAIGGGLALIVTGDGTGPTSTVGQVSDLHGDVTATIDNTAGVNTVSSSTAYSEYGAQPTPTSPARYGWLGAHQRPTEPLSALILMGVRLYNPATGRFLSVDPIPGGSAGPYPYPTNPITAFDLNGQWWRTALRRAATFTGLLAAGACIVATAGACAALTWAAVGASVAWNSYQVRNGTDSGKRLSVSQAAYNIGIDGVATKFRAVRHFSRSPVLKVRWRPHLSGGRYGGFYLKSVEPSRSLRWHARQHPWHTAIWGGTNAYYGYRAVRNGW